MDSLTPILVIAILIVLNGLFVAAEFAIVGAPRQAIDRRAARGERLARIVRDILDDPRQQDRFIATAQVGITVATIGLGMYGEHVVAQWIAAALEGLGTARWVAAHAVASTLAVIGLTYFHIVVGEMVPKALALQHAERTALWITLPILTVKSLLYPLVVGLNGLGNLMLRMLGITRQASAEQYYSPDELRLVIEESREGGALRAAPAGMLRELLEFDELTARQVMVPRVRVTGIPVGTGHDDLRAIVRTSPHSRYPVYEKDLDHILGIIHIKDALRLMTSGEVVQRRHVRPVPILPDTTSLDAVLTAMGRQHTQMAVTIDEHGGVAGIVTLDDLFEEVVGEIPETRTRLKIHRDSAGALLVSGETRLDELAEYCGIGLEHETVDSVSGLILSLLGRPGTVGDVVESGGLRLMVTEVHGYGVAECAVTRVES